MPTPGKLTSANQRPDHRSSLRNHSSDSRKMSGSAPGVFAHREGSTRTIRRPRWLQPGGLNRARNWRALSLQLTILRTLSVRLASILDQRPHAAGDQTVPVARIWLDTTEGRDVPRTGFAEPASQGRDCSGSDFQEHDQRRAFRLMAREQLLRTEPFQRHQDQGPQSAGHSGHRIRAHRNSQ